MPFGKETQFLDREIVIANKNQELHGILSLPSDPQGIILFSHGSGSSRLSPRNNYVAHVLHRAHFATLLVDLLTEGEEKNRKNVFDLNLLSDRLLLVQKWVFENIQIANLKMGLFGASTGAGAALIAAAKEPHNIHAIVSRGGRPDLAGDHLSQVQAPTLLLVGSLDQEVINLNRKAMKEMKCEKELQVIAGASHLFEEPGKLEKVAQRATMWFHQHLQQQSAGASRTATPNFVDLHHNQH